MSAPDSLIVRRVVAGDVEAFGLLVDRYHARCLRSATALLGDPDTAEDAVQEAFLRAYRHLGSYRERDRFGAWLTRIVVNQCRSQLSRNQRFASGDAGIDLDAFETPEGADAALALDARREELDRALAQLPPEQREAVVLRFTDELTFDEMSTITGVGVSALKMRVQRACARLRALLSEHLHA